MPPPLLWKARACDETAAARLTAELGLPPVVARLLVSRGHHDPDLAARFLRPSLDHLLDPWRLTDLAPAVERLLGAVARRERIVIHGDYDVDGVTSTVILRRTLELLGGDVSHFIPERLRDGYGLQPATIDRLHAAGARVIVSVDCGIRAPEAARRATELGVDLIITDHHEPDDQLPARAGGGQSQARRLQLSRQAPGRRRRRAQAGAGALPEDRPRGLAAGVRQDGGDRHARRRRPAGRREPGHRQARAGAADAAARTASDCARCSTSPGSAARPSTPITSPSWSRRGSTPPAAWPPPIWRRACCWPTTRPWPAEVQALAQQLDAENTRRREEEQDIVAAARKIVDTDPDVGAQPVLVVAGEGWHRGVIGIVASKLVDAYYRPAIVLSIEDGEAHGSCRSIPGFDILARARVVRADAAPLRRPQAGGGPAARVRRHQRVPARGQRLRTRPARPRRPAAAAPSRRPAAASTRSRRRSWST